MVVSLISNFSADLSRIQLRSHSEATELALSKVSSGQRVFRASEDPAALAIGSALAIDVAALRSAQINVQQGTSTLQIADGALTNMAELTNRMKTLANQAISAQVSDTARGYIDVEYQELLREIDRISADTKFNGVVLLGGQTEFAIAAQGTSVDTNDGFVGFEFNQNVNNGDVFRVSYFAPTKVMTITNATQGIAQTIAVDSPSVGFLNEYTFERAGVTITLNSDFDDTTTFAHTGANEEFQANALATATALNAVYQVGTATDASDRVNVNLPVINSASMNLAGTNLLTIGDARLASSALDVALDMISSTRATVGASISRLETVGLTITTTIENSEAARSALLDADIASELTELTSKQVLTEAAVNMLTRANQRPQTLLQLLQG